MVQIFRWTPSSGWKKELRGSKRGDWSWATIQERVLENEIRKLRSHTKSGKRPSRSLPEDLPVDIKKPAAAIPEAQIEIAAAETPSFDLFRTHSGIDSFRKIE